MFLPGLGWPMRPQGMDDKEWERILVEHRRQERIGGRVALGLLGLGLGAFILFWILYAIKF